MDVDKDSLADSTLAAGGTTVLASEKMYMGATTKDVKSQKVQVVSAEVGIFADTTLEAQQGDGKAVVQLADGKTLIQYFTAPQVVNLVCSGWLGLFGGTLALLGVVAAPITSGDTAFRSARLIIAEALHFEQKSMARRLMISIPLFVVSLLLLIWQMENPDGFNVLWQYFGWFNQALSVFTLWMITVYLAHEHKPYIITLIPAIFMTVVCTTFLVASPQAMGREELTSWVALAVIVVSVVWFAAWLRKDRSTGIKQQ